MPRIFEGRAGVIEAARGLVVEELWSVICDNPSSGEPHIPFCYLLRATDAVDWHRFFVDGDVVCWEQWRRGEVAHELREASVDLAPLLKMRGHTVVDAFARASASAPRCAELVVRMDDHRELIVSRQAGFWIFSPSDRT